MGAIAVPDPNILAVSFSSSSPSFLFLLFLHKSRLKRVYSDQFLQGARDHSCDILTKNVAAFGSSPKNLPEAELESNGLGISLVVVISRQSNTDSAMWLLITFVLVYDAEEQVRQNEIHTLQSEEKKSTRKCNVAVKACDEGEEETKVRPAVAYRQGCPPGFPSVLSASCLCPIM